MLSFLKGCQDTPFSPGSFCHHVWNLCSLTHFIVSDVPFSNSYSGTTPTGERRSFWCPTVGSCRKARRSISHCRRWKKLSKRSDAAQRWTSATCRQVESGFSSKFAHVHTHSRRHNWSAPIWNGTTFWFRCKPSGLCYCNICQGSHTFLERICKTFECFHLQGKSWNAPIFFCNYFWGIHNIFQ